MGDPFAEFQPIEENGPPDSFMRGVFSRMDSQPPDGRKSDLFIDKSNASPPM
jgi:hypothetical protein